VNWSAGLDALEPAPVVTVTVTVPVPGGEVAVQVVLAQFTSAAAAAPKVTRPFIKLEPKIVTDVPPPAGPTAGLRPRIIGAGWRFWYVN
jgi:hypothetical protein